MGFTDILTGGGEETNVNAESIAETYGDVQEGHEDLNADQTTSTSSDEKTPEQKLEEKRRKEYQDKISDDRTGFILHQGDILQTHTYETIFSTSWNSDYEGMSSDGTITIPFHKDDLQYIYKGVRCLLKTKRFNNFDEDIEIDDSEGYLCFITDVNISDNKLELSLSGYEKLLEQENILSFTNQRRSVILAEVIKMAGLEPVIDITGLPDERINWSTEKESKKDKESSSGGSSKIEASDELNDKMDSYELSAEYKITASMKTGFIPENMDSKTKFLKAIGKDGTNYADYVHDCTSVCDVVKKLRAKMHYSGYANCKWKDAEDCFNHIGEMNCADSAKLMKCCMDVCGFPCAILHGNNHYFNVVKKDSKWYTVDLCFRSTIGQEGSTNTLGC